MCSGSTGGTTTAGTGALRSRERQATRVREKNYLIRFLASDYSYQIRIPAGQGRPSQAMPLRRALDPIGRCFGCRLPVAVPGKTRETPAPATEEKRAAKPVSPPKTGMQEPARRPWIPRSGAGPKRCTKYSVHAAYLMHSTGTMSCRNGCLPTASPAVSPLNGQGSLHFSLFFFPDGHVNRKGVCLPPEQQRQSPFSCTVNSQPAFV